MAKCRAPAARSAAHAQADLDRKLLQQHGSEEDAKRAYEQKLA